MTTRQQERAGRRGCSNSIYYDAGPFSPPVRMTEMVGFSARINRHTGKSHEHRREIARRTRAAIAKTEAR